MHGNKIKYPQIAIMFDPRQNLPNFQFKSHAYSLKGYIVCSKLFAPPENRLREKYTRIPLVDCGSSSYFILFFFCLREDFIIMR